MTGYIHPQLGGPGGQIVLYRVNGHSTSKYTSSLNCQLNINLAAQYLIHQWHMQDRAISTGFSPFNLQ